jgi:hypothetical protein
MMIPERVTSRWIATLGDEQLIAVESELYDAYQTQETREKRKRGAHYALLRGPEILVTAWHRWSLVNNETRTRGLFVYHRR